MSLFETYSTPYPATQYSSEYFKALTFRDVSVLNYPSVNTHVRTFMDWKFLDAVPMALNAAQIIHGETIPSLIDILPVSRGLADAYAAGKRSISVQVHAQTTRSVYHFSKIRLFILINNNQLPVDQARRVVRHLGSLILPPGDFLAHLERQYINAPICGFHVSSFPLWKLGCLLGENWLEEDIINTLLELMYFRNAAPSTDMNPPSILLPTSFYNDAKYLFHQNPRLYSNNIVDLRSRLRATHAATVSFIVCEDHHFSGFNSDEFSLEHGDTMGHIATEDALPIWNWVMADLDYFPHFGVVERNISGQDLAPGSCGVGAINFVGTRHDPTIPCWTDKASPMFRDVALRDLIIYHTLASFNTGEYTDWVKPCNKLLLQTPELVNSDGPFGHNDFNMATPLAQHPIYKFLEIIRGHVDVSQPTWLTVKEIKPEYTLADSKQLLQLNVTCVPPLNQLCTADLGTGHEIQSFHMKVDSSRRRRLTSTPIVYDLTTPSPPPHSVFLPLPRVISVKQECIKMEVLDLTRSSPSGVLHIDDDIIMVLSDDETKSSQDSALQLPHGKKWKTENSSITPPSTSRPSSTSTTLLTIQPILVGSVFETFDKCREAVLAYQRAFGHRWKTVQSKRDKHGNVRRVTLRCNRYYHHTPTHSLSVDPSDHRIGKTIKTGCSAHVNTSRMAGSQLWHVTLTNWTHNHAREIPLGGHVPQRPTKAQQTVVDKFSTVGNFNRDQIKAIVTDRFPDHLLEPRQITNLMNSARLEARKEVARLGGDVATIIASLQKLKDEDPGWSFDVRLDESQTVVGLWWQSPTQAGLTSRFSDLLINDNTYNRNQYGYPLNIGIGIDNLGHSRNLWYALHQTEDTDTHCWVFRLHLHSAGCPPEALFSDRHPSLIASARITMPLSWHFYCLYHLNGNVTLHIRIGLGPLWDDFTRDFWATYRAVSPEEFDRLWTALIIAYPSTAGYLQEELYPCRERWAWAWLSTVFTGGIRTNGRVEVENRVNKAFGGPKKTLFQLFNSLNERTSNQTAREMIHVRESSRRQHHDNLEAVFTGPLELLRTYVGPFALHTCFQQMQQSLFYRTEVIQLPAHIRTWAEYILASSAETGFVWSQNEEHSMLNTFTNDNSHISIRWLLRLVLDRGMAVRHLIRVIHLASGAAHIIAVLPDDRHMCDCCMGINLGIPCRHFFQAWTTFKGMKFHVALIRPRWYKDPSTDITAVLGVTFEQKTTTGLTDIDAVRLPAHMFSNPVDRVRRPITNTPPPSTQTLGARIVNKEAQAALRPLLEGVRTQEELDEVLGHLYDIRSARNKEAQEQLIHDPPLLNPKGRPRTARITGPLEGRAKGGGASSTAPMPVVPTNTEPNSRGLLPPASSLSSRKCGVCRQHGHNRTRCPLVIG